MLLVKRIGSFAKGKIDLERIEVVGNLFINQEIVPKVVEERIQKIFRTKK